MSEAVSTVPAYRFRGPVALCVDLKNPLSYLALEPTFTLVDELGVALECLPFAAAALKAPTPARADDDRATRHRRLRAEYMARDIARYSRVQHLVIQDIYRSPDTSAFAAGLLWLNERNHEQVRPYLRAAFDRYWRGGLKLEVPGAIAEVMGKLVQDAAAFASYAKAEGLLLTANLREQLVAAGVFSAPSIVVQDQVFVGRAHLPMVRWLLQGRRGPPPV